MADIISLSLKLDAVDALKSIQSFTKTIEDAAKSWDKAIDKASKNIDEKLSEMTDSISSLSKEIDVSVAVGEIKVDDSFDKALESFYKNVKNQIQQKVKTVSADITTPLKVRVSSLSGNIEDVIVSEVADAVALGVRKAPIGGIGIGNAAQELTTLLLVTLPSVINKAVSNIGSEIANSIKPITDAVSNLPKDLSVTLDLSSSMASIRDEIQREPIDTYLRVVSVTTTSDFTPSGTKGAGTGEGARIKIPAALKVVTIVGSPITVDAKLNIKGYNPKTLNIDVKAAVDLKLSNVNDLDAFVKSIQDSLTVQLVVDGFIPASGKTWEDFAGEISKKLPIYPLIKGFVEEWTESDLPKVPELHACIKTIDLRPDFKAPKVDEYLNELKASIKKFDVTKTVIKKLTSDISDSPDFAPTIKDIKFDLSDDVLSNLEYDLEFIMSNVAVSLEQDLLDVLGKFQLKLIDHVVEGIDLMSKEIDAVLQKERHIPTVKAQAGGGAFTPIDITDTIKDAVTNAINSVRTTSKDISKASLKIAKDVTDEAVKNISGIDVDRLVDVPHEKLYNAMRVSEDAIVKSGKAHTESISRGLGKVGDFLKDVFISPKVKDIIRKGLSTETRIKDLSEVSDTIDNIVKGLSDEFGDTKEALSSISNSIKKANEAAKDASSLFTKPEDVVSGFADAFNLMKESGDLMSKEIVKLPMTDFSKAYDSLLLLQKNIDEFSGIQEKFSGIPEFQSRMEKAQIMMGMVGTNLANTIEAFVQNIESIQEGLPLDADLSEVIALELESIGDKLRDVSIVIPTGVDAPAVRDFMESLDYLSVVLQNAGDGVETVGLQGLSKISSSINTVLKQLEYSSGSVNDYIDAMNRASVSVGAVPPQHQDVLTNTIMSMKNAVGSLKALGTTSGIVSGTFKSVANIVKRSGKKIDSAFGKLLKSGLGLLGGFSLIRTMVQGIDREYRAAQLGAAGGMYQPGKEAWWQQFRGAAIKGLTEEEISEMFGTAMMQKIFEAGERGVKQMELYTKLASESTQAWKVFGATAEGVGVLLGKTLRFAGVSMLGFTKVQEYMTMAMQKGRMSFLDAAAAIDVFRGRLAILETMGGDATLAIAGIEDAVATLTLVGMDAQDAIQTLSGMFDITNAQKFAGVFGLMGMNVMEFQTLLLRGDTQKALDALMTGLSKLPAESVLRFGTIWERITGLSRDALETMYAASTKWSDISEDMRKAQQEQEARLKSMAESPFIKMLNEQMDTFQMMVKVTGGRIRNVSDVFMLSLLPSLKRILPVVELIAEGLFKVVSVVASFGETLSYIVPTILAAVAALKTFSIVAAIAQSLVHPVAAIAGIAAAVGVGAVVFGALKSVTPDEKSLRRVSEEMEAINAQYKERKKYEGMMPPAYGVGATRRQEWRMSNETYRFEGAVPGYQKGVAGIVSSPAMVGEKGKELVIAAPVSKMNAPGMQDVTSIFGKQTDYSNVLTKINDNVGSISRKLNDVTASTMKMVDNAQMEVERDRIRKIKEEDFRPLRKVPIIEKELLQTQGNGGLESKSELTDELIVSNNRLSTLIQRMITVLTDIKDNTEVTSKNTRKTRDVSLFHSKEGV